MDKKKLAEFIGIMLGDGNLYSKDGTHRFVITGHSEEDYDYLTNYVKPLIKTLFNKEASLWKHKNKNAIALSVCSKDIIEKLISLGLVSGPKTMEIPNFAKKNKKLIANFIRGVADTDFSMTFKKKNHSYPLITGGFSNENFTKQLKNLLELFNIKANIYTKLTTLGNKTFIQYQIDIYGRHNLKKWMKFIGFSNPKHLTKIAIWNKLGYYTPHTPYLERVKLLKQ
ncbi:MAG: LAGLIDADG family homing endonuclease [Candidatus Nanoarchaeia archaeon]